MSARGGRERLRRDHVPQASSSSRLDEKYRGNNATSRHLWVGNISHRVSEKTLTDHFLRFGPLEKFAFQPGRSYAFVDFKREEDAMAAMNALQGLNVAGLALRIEFAKADKSSAPSRDENYSRRDEQRSTNRGSPFSQRESRMRQASPDAFLPVNSRVSDDSEETPSEVLWIGFPALLKVDETILRKAFSPFGEIEKITVFPGRSYAFVRFRGLMSACRAKETLQGKLFGNPRVHICFAKNDIGSSSSGRRNAGQMLLLHILQMFRNFGNTAEDDHIRPRHFVSNVDYGDPDMLNFGMKEPAWKAGNVAYEQKRFNELGPERGFSEGFQGYCNSPVIDGNTEFHDFSPQKFPRRSAIPEDPWDSPEDVHRYHQAKKFKSESFPLEKELPEYPFSDSEQGKHVLPRMFYEYPSPDKSGAMGGRQTSDHHRLSLTQPFGDTGDSWKASQDARDAFHSSSGSFSSNPVEWKRPSPELHRPTMNKEWKWEGTIAKGGTPVCRARCFPVGKVLDIILPEFLDCTSRTGLDMLAKHYYQAAGTWVVFFVPESDADIGYYNEFMNYLGEKQRAAVSKIDEKNTLFLVPPSDFSEKVLKVPGKLSISGVVLRLEPSGSHLGSVPAAPHERKHANLMPQSDSSYQKSESPSGRFPLVTSYLNAGKPGFRNFALQMSAAAQAPTSSFSGYDNTSQSMSESMEKRREYPPNQHAAAAFGPNWSPHQLQSSVPGFRNTASHASHGAVDPGQEPNMGSNNRRFTGPVSGSNVSSLEETKTSASLAMPFGALQPEQLAQLASSLLGQQRQPGSSSAVSGAEDFRLSSLNQPETPSRAPQRYANQVPPEQPTSQFGQLQQLQQAADMPAVPHGQENQQLPISGNLPDEGETDPQKRLQATLQLAAALLQQIQQGKGT
ncbi:hypothetical protein Nepgr_000688 [Nepenthes gracilis]|uniref:RRM domain-containing protein n=1 Tax=Nepenthes gracilis TaxID=150966 RepID=A0AAD3RWE1_NEPGR|nr:hypothetical protein Nepgr_000688 [Nepenthes gracilis]